MKAVFTSGSKKKKSKYILLRRSGSGGFTKKLNCEDHEMICFSSFSALNNKKNLEYIQNVSIDGAESTGMFSDCHKIKKDIFSIDNDQDGLSPTVYEVFPKKNINRFFINCGNWAPEDYFEKALKIKKRFITGNFTIKDNKLVIFILPDMTGKLCKTRFNKKDLKNFSSDFNNFIKDRKEKDKILEFNVKNGTYNIYSFPGPVVTGEDDMAGHLIELKKW